MRQNKDDERAERDRAGQRKTEQDRENEERIERGRVQQKVKDS
jgi:hypothetical protein